MNFENLEQVEVLSAITIRKRLEVLNTNTTPDEVGRLIKDISALLVSRNTVVGNFPDMLFLISDIADLLAPLEDCGYIKFNAEAAVNKDGYIPIIFINSPVEQHLVKEIVRRGNTKDLPALIDVHTPIVHAHIDTTALIEPKAGLRTLIDNNENFLHSRLHGRGVIDMKSQIAVIIMSLYILKSLDKKPPLVILTSDEEMSCVYSKDILNYIYPHKGVFDLEPCKPDALSNEIRPSSRLNFFLGAKRSSKYELIKDRKISYEKSLEDLQCSILYLAQTYYPKPLFDVHITAEVGKFSISIIDIEGYNSILSINKEFETQVKMLIENCFEVITSSFSPYPSLQSELSPRLKNAMSQILPRRKVVEITLQNKLTTTDYERDIIGRASISHNFNTASSLTWGEYGVDDIGNIGPREDGEGRHSEDEVLFLHDDVILYHNLVEFLTIDEVGNSEQYFIEA